MERLKIDTTLIFSADWHVHLYKTHATITQEGYNSRLMACMNVPIAIGNFAKSFDYPMLHGFLGDLLQSRNSVDITVANVVRENLRRLRENLVYTFASIGNHDLYFRQARETSLKLFEPELTIMPEEGLSFELSQGGTLFLYSIPYTVDKGELLDKLKIAKKKRCGDVSVLMMHTGIAEAEVGITDYRLKEEVSVSDVKKAGYDYTLVGHYHKFQDMGDGIIIPGSPIQHTFGERGVDKGFVSINLETGIWFLNPIKAPQFMEIVVVDNDLPFTEGWIGNYIGLVFEDLETFRYSQEEKWVQYLLEQGVLSVVCNLRSPKRGLEFGECSGGLGNLSLDELLSQFVKFNGGDHVEVLEKLGFYLLEVAENS